MSKSAKVIFYEQILTWSIIAIYTVGIISGFLLLALIDELCMNTAEKSLTEIVDLPAALRADMAVNCAESSNDNMSVFVQRMCELITEGYATLVEPLFSTPAYHLRNIFIEVKAVAWGTDVCYFSPVKVYK